MGALADSDTPPSTRNCGSSEAAAGSQIMYPALMSNAQNITKVIMRYLKYSAVCCSYLPLSHTPSP